MLFAYGNRFPDIDAQMLLCGVVTQKRLGFTDERLLQLNSIKTYFFFFFTIPPECFD